MSCMLFVIAQEMFSLAEAPDYASAFTRMLLALFVVIALLFATYWFLRKWTQGRFSFSHGATEKIRLVEKKILSNKSILYLIDVKGEEVLIVESHAEVRRLHTLKNPFDESTRQSP